MKYRIVTFLVFGTAIFWLAEQGNGENRLPFTKALNHWWLDFCIANSSDQISSAAVSFVRIDDSYEPALPSDDLTRLDYAVILASIGKFKPRSVSIVPPLRWDEPNPINQKALETQCLKMPPLTLAAIAENSPTPDEKFKETRYETLARIEGDTSIVPSFNRTISYPESDLLANGKAAFTQIELSNPGNQGPAIFLPLIAKHGDDIVPSFILQSIVSFEKMGLGDVAVQLPPASSRGRILVGNRFTIPVDPAGRIMLYQHAAIAPPLYKTIKASELPLAHSEEPAIKALQTELADEFQSLASNLIVLGLDRDKDRNITLANGDNISLAELITRTIATVQSGRYIQQWPLWGRIGGFGITTLAACMLYKLGRRQMASWGALLLFLYLGAHLFIFKTTLMWTPPLAPLALFVALILIGVILPHVPVPKLRPGEEDTDGKLGGAT